MFRQTTLDARFEGPLPPPSILAQYDQVAPGAAERILGMAERQSSHRIALEARVVSSDVVRSYLGLLLGFVVVIVFGVIAWDLIKDDHTIPGTFLGTVDIGSLGGLFVYGSRARQRELRDRALATKK